MMTRPSNVSIICLYHLICLISWWIWHVDMNEMRRMMTIRRMRKWQANLDWIKNDDCQIRRNLWAPLYHYLLILAITTIIRQILCGIENMSWIRKYWSAARWTDHLTEHTFPDSIADQYFRSVGRFINDDRSRYKTNISYAIFLPSYDINIIVMVPHKFCLSIIESTVIKYIFSVLPHKLTSIHWLSLSPSLC